MISQQTLALTLLFFSALAAEVPAQEPTPGSELTPNDWLLSAPNERERLERLQRQLRGFDQPMWEVGERYRSLYDALERKNFDLALYHWDKIGTTIRNGIVKRPARGASAKAIFLNETFETVRAGLAARTADKAWDAFSRARAACQACHRAEQVPFMNEQPLFDLVPPVRDQDAEAQ